MAHVIPENFRNHKEISSVVARACTALRNGLDDSCVVWAEPPFDPSGDKPDLVVLIPDHGLAVVEVMDVRSSRLLGSLRGKMIFERDGQEVEQPSTGTCRDLRGGTSRARRIGAATRRTPVSGGGARRVPFARRGRGCEEGP